MRAVPFLAMATSQKFGLARDFGDRLQSRNVPFDTSGDYHNAQMYQILDLFLS